MRSRKKPALIAVVLLLAITIVLVAAWVYQGRYCQPYCNACGDHKKEWYGAICSFVDNAEALFALALVVCNVLAFSFLHWQISQTEDAIALSREANAHTKRSVDAFVEAERGRVHVHGLRIFPVEDSSTTSDLHFIIENIGNGLITITAEWIDVCYLPTGRQAVPIIEPPFRLNAVWQPIVGHGRIEATKDRTLGMEARRPFRMPEMPDWAATIIVRMVFRYDTSFEVTRLAGFTWSADTKATWMVRVPTQSYTFDVPIDFDFSKRP